MIRIVVDSSLEQSLRSAQEDVELCSTTGDVLGFFTPTVDHALYEKVQLKSSTEELLRRAKAGGGRTLAEIMVDLQKRT